jgi:RimJ/RimL family protein N-acetyltransferase
MKIEVISPFPVESLPRVWAWTENFRARISDDFGPQTLEEFIDAMLMNEGQQKTWAVYADGELGGMITYQRLTPWLGTAHCVFKPEFQGRLPGSRLEPRIAAEPRRRIAVDACTSAVREMFEQGIGKLVFYPLAGNIGLGAMLQRMGAKCEGQLRAHTLCGGQPKAMKVYGLLKQEFEHASSNRSSSNRRGSLDTRELPVGPAEDQHLNDHPDVGTGPAGTDGPAPAVQLEPDEQHRPDVQADADERIGRDQPPLRDHAGADFAADGIPRVR